jgi:two-component system response regulator HydG
MPARLLIEHSDGRHEEVPLPLDCATTLGRSRKCTICLSDKHISGHHAKITYRESRWFLSDCESMNGTYLDGRRLEQEAALEHGQVIVIGGVRLKFLTGEDDGTPESTQIAPAAEPARQPFVRLSDDSEVLPASEALAILRFMKQALDESSHLQVIRRALEAIQAQSGAGTVGFLSFDADAPVPRLVIPQRRGLDDPLSRKLTQQVQRSGRTVWIGEIQQPGELSDSLVSYSDAFCVPLGTRDAPQGAVHVYVSGKQFSKDDVRFVEALADCLSRNLKQHIRQRGLRAENQRLRRGPRVQDDLLGTSAPMEFVRERLKRVADSRCRTILIAGESGTGKELVATQLHECSARADKPFVTVNCASLPKELADSHLFGHERGAFSGAVEARAGFFREADDGTLFLDEIAELPPECQAKLLRVVDGQGFRPMGAGEDVYVDVRIVAATNKDLGELVRRGEFRKDLRQRFEVSLAMPPLRERQDDIPELARYFATRIAGEHGRQVKLTEAAIDRLKSFPWPGNVRQLRAALTEAITFCDRDTLDADDLDLSPDDTGIDESRPHSLKLADVEAWAIRKALRQAAGSDLIRVAKSLGINRDTLRAKMKKLDIRRE